MVQTGQEQRTSLNWNVSANIISNNRWHGKHLISKKITHNYKSHSNLYINDTCKLGPLQKIGYQALKGKLHSVSQQHSQNINTKQMNLVLMHECLLLVTADTHCLSAWRAVESVHSVMVFSHIMSKHQILYALGNFYNIKAPEKWIRKLTLNKMVVMSTKDEKFS